MNTGVRPVSNKVAREGGGRARQYLFCVFCFPFNANTKTMFLKTPRHKTGNSIYFGSLWTSVIPSIRYRYLPGAKIIFAPSKSSTDTTTTASRRMLENKGIADRANQKEQKSSVSIKMGRCTKVSISSWMPLSLGPGGGRASIWGWGAGRNSENRGSRVGVGL